MASTTTAKKEIIDFLWEWAEPKGDWAKLLIDNIVKTESALSISEREQVFDHFIDSLRTKRKLAAITVHKPIFKSTDKTIKLATLSNVTGVNRLAKNQKMDFANNLTVVYGENGTGKTGYGRILKTLGFSYDVHNTIHHNIYGVNEPKSATIDFSVNGLSSTFNWNGSNVESSLSNISVFNNNCVQISLTDRKLIVSPIGFHLFNIVTSELVELSNLLNVKKSSYPVTLLWSATLHEGTAQHTFINGLTDKSSEEQLAKLSEFPTNILDAIIQKEKSLQGLNQELITTQIRNLTTQISELTNVVSKIKGTQAIFSKTVWDGLIILNETIVSLQGKSKVGLKEIAEANDIQFYETQQFKNFIISAENYINLLEPPYPKIGDECIYCKQPLEEPAKQLLSAYKKLLNDTTETDLRNSNKSRTELINKINLVESNIILNQASFGIDTESNVIQPIELYSFNKKIQSLKDAFVNNTLSKEINFDLSYSAIIKVLEDQKSILSETLKIKNEALLTIAEQVSAIQTEINELKDRKMLADNEVEIKKVILNKKNLALLNSKASEFNTASISRKTTEAREELISQNFGETFQKELKAFGKSHLKIDLSFGTDKGNSKISQKINQYTLTDILSEGEQKAIALAEFLTELDLDNTKAPVVFDDPVNSLDHNIIDDVAIRLIKLSKNRQVVIFTHSILLLNSLLQQSKLPTNAQQGIDFTFYAVKNNFGDTGILDDVEGINSHTFYINKLKKVLECLDKSLSEEKLASEGYGHLRAAIEVCVEEDVLKNTIIRYRKGVAFPALLRIDGTKIDSLKGDLNELYEKCCTSIDGHSSPDGVHVTPSIFGLKSDFESYKKIRTAFQAK
ncbi:AAA family ATPase [Pedobacter sp. MC2016-05]|uniref:AAA family ATPase n=1 Tax=Pedobacter sp. MC2016-05 TaxID=2994474 RepID=UPI0022475427|nr:AAA family ATPase [Pedobacter sp. MC2016-05]MCX2474644.1 AAA family ATPase [Pedobacter sp. MC2016-05]